VTFGARASIRLNAIRQNLQFIQSKSPGSPVMAVVKANAYGHGMLQVAQALSAVDCLAVARLAEARKLREANIKTPIALLGGVLSGDDYAEVDALGIHAGVQDEQQIQWLEQSAKTVPVAWLKIDTGMTRLGIDYRHARAAIKRLQKCTDDLRLMTHFSSADDRSDPTTREQLDRFLALLDEFDGDISVANSPSLLGWSDDLARISAQGRLWIRPGLSLYGISPFADQCGADLGLSPAMQFEAHLISVKKIRKGTKVGYGGTWQAEEETILGVVAAGYGDGYSRYIPTGTPVMVNGREVPVVGRISMDLTSVDLGPAATDKTGDPVLLWGDELPVERIADCANTIPYQLLSGVTHREKPIYED
jgi:alanine racemase